MRVLSLDDQPGLADTLALSLRIAGYSAKGFNRPIESLAALEEGNVLVTNYHMPEMTGLEVAKRAYAAGWRGSLLIMSGHVAAIDEPIEHPLLHFLLSKPFETKALIEALPHPEPIP